MKQYIIRMKQISYILYLSLVLLSISCSKNEIGKGEVETKQHISFAQPQTRSTLLGSSSTLPSLDVIIYETDPDTPALSEDDVVNYLPMSSLSLDGFDNSWRHSPAAPWPVNLDQELTFLAMSPSMPLADNPDFMYETFPSPTGPVEPIENLSINGLAYLPSEDNNFFYKLGELQGRDFEITSDDFLAAFYKLPTDVKNHPDLMFSSAADSYTAVSNSASKSVNLEFHHALTAVSFSVIGKPTQKITSITINNIATSGSVMYFPEIDLSIFGSSGIQENFFLWFATDEMVNVNAPLKEVVPNRDNPTSLTPEGSILMLIPSNENWDTSFATVTVEYTDEGTPLTQELKFPNNHEWVAGVHNNYKITIPEAVGPMIISVSAIPWNNEERDITTDSWGPDQGGGGSEEGEKIPA